MLDINKVLMALELTNNNIDNKDITTSINMAVAANKRGAPTSINTGVAANDWECVSENLYRDSKGNLRMTTS